MDILLQDIRYAARKLLRSPSFTVVAVSTLALAIGATTTVFSIVNGVLLTPLPFRDPSALVRLGSVSKDGKVGTLSGADFVDYEKQTHSFTGIAAFTDRNSANLSVNGADPVRLNSATVGAKFFDLLGVTMQLGRGFAEGEDRSGAEPVVVLSNRLWRDHFGSDPKVVGRTISLNGTPFTVVGVAPASTRYPASADLWEPFVFTPWLLSPDNRGMHVIGAIARLRPGVTIDAAKRDMSSIAERLQREYPESNTNFGATAQKLQDSVTGNVGKALWTMFGAVAFVLLIACANVANLLLVRAAGRETEIAVRTALGAGRGRIVRQLVTESILLSVAGTVIGGALAGWAVDAIVVFGPKGLPRLDAITLDARVLGFSALVAVVTGLVFGLVPALSASRTQLAETLREGARGTGGRRAAQRTRGALVVGEMALAVVLLVGAGLLIQSFMKLIRVDPGFRPERVVTFDVTLPFSKYPYDRDIRQFEAQLQEALGSMPGTESVAAAFARPMEQIGMRTGFDIDGRPPAPAARRMVTDLRGATADLFSTLGMRVVRGRSFTAEEERYGPPPVVVVTESFAKKYFPNEDPIGLIVTFGFEHDSAAGKSLVAAHGRIIGIVNDVQQRGLGRTPEPAAYVGWGTLGISEIAFLVRSRAPMRTVAAAIRERVRAIDPALPVYDLHAMEDVVSESVSQPRFYTILLTAFAALALLLAALGVYGVISYSVSQRTRELGIRIALGATQERVVRSIVGSGMWLAVSGIAIGLTGAYWLVHLLGTMLYSVKPTDSATFAGVATLLVGVAALASYVPARRASMVDPVIAMRAE